MKFTTTYVLAIWSENENWQLYRKSRNPQICYGQSYVCMGEAPVPKYVERLISEYKDRSKIVRP
jgi:hypothetical protein